MSDVRRSDVRPGRRRGAAGAALLLLTLVLVAACGPAAPTPAASAPGTETPAPSSTISTPAGGTPTATPAGTAPVPPGTVLVEIPEAGVAVPVPSRWRTLDAIALADPTVQADLAATYPGAAELLDAVAEVEGWAEPAFLAVDPAAAGTTGPPAASLSVLVAQPSVGGPLLDLAAGFICDAMTDVLAAPTSPPREREELPIGEAVRCTYDLPAAAGQPLVAEAWVIGAPAATVLVTLLGPVAAIDGLSAREIVAAIVPAPTPAP